MEKELVAMLQELVELMEAYGLENLKHNTNALHGSKKKPPLPYEKACRLLERYRETQVRKSVADAQQVIDKAKQS